ncbi:NUDIX hydrolase [Nocardioides acrostichi]|uniref:NUDIX domain-containing protein n=1 Tax=Nocardioides acrostichi TaxID=2784339 RepID=A0A930V370_9ACTN|nr:NUDIX domain-containing protein [Nocardioides acrostichi]MBF4163036.1 NUDIX domain-containing protein [Nocardioides acrostichi]
MSEPILRITARVLPVSERGEVLLLCDQDPGHPGDLRWGTIGGAVDPGESLPEAGVREMFEETGVVVDAGALVGPVHQDRLEFSYDGTRYLGDSTFFAVPLARDVEVSFAHLEPAEVGNVLEARWWRPADVRDDGRLVSPDLPDIMELAIAAIERGSA